MPWSAWPTPTSGFGLLTITAVDCDPDLRQAHVLFSSLDDEMQVVLADGAGPPAGRDLGPGALEAHPAAALRSRSGRRRRQSASRTSCGSCRRPAADEEPDS